MADTKTDLPQTAIQLKPVEFDFQGHDWQQRGYWIHCSGHNRHGNSRCHIGHPHGHGIPVGSNLMLKEGQWYLAEEEVKTIVD